MLNVIIFVNGILMHKELIDDPDVNAIYHYDTSVKPCHVCYHGNEAASLFMWKTFGSKL